MSSDIEQQVTRICERAKHELIALLLALPVTADPPAPPIQEWMTAKQLAEYWQLLTNDNQPRTAGIMKWVNRLADQFPLPHAYMGDLLRFRRDDVDRWAHEEAIRRSDLKMKRLRD
ncbi:MAG: hypothetical protein WAM70_06505 [Pyrinomonadaceae bacterium]